MVVERIAAGPVDDLDVGVGQSSTVVIEFTAGIQQHVRDRGHRNQVRNGIDALWQGRQRIRHRGQTGFVHRPVSVPESCTRNADSTEHRRQGDTHPRSLFAVPRALQRPGDRHHRAFRRHLPSEIRDHRGLDAADRRRPLRGFGGSVSDTEEVSLEFGVSLAVLRQKRCVVQVLVGKNECESQHHRHVGTGPRRDPSSVAAHVVAQRTHGDDLTTAGAHRVERIDGRMIRCTTVIDAGVLHRNAAERHQQFGMCGNHAPGCGAREHLPMRTENVRHDDAGRTQGVTVHRSRVAADAVQEAMHLALRVVEASGTRPTVRPTVDRAVTECAHDSAQFGRQQIGELVPGHVDELVAATVIRRTRTVLQPTSAHRR